jgi:hypothetical protein
MVFHGVNKIEFEMNYRRSRFGHVSLLNASLNYFDFTDVVKICPFGI